MVTTTLSTLDTNYDMTTKSKDKQERLEEITLQYLRGEIDLNTFYRMADDLNTQISVQEIAEMKRKRSVKDRALSFFSNP